MVTRACSLQPFAAGDAARDDGVADGLARHAMVGLTLITKRGAVSWRTNVAHPDCRKYLYTER